MWLMVAWGKLGGMLTAHKQQQAIKIKSDVGTEWELLWDSLCTQWEAATSIWDWGVAWGVLTSPWGKGWLYCLQHALYLPFTLRSVLCFKIKLFWSEIGAYRLQVLKTVTAPPYLSSEVMSNGQNTPCKESVTWKPYNLQSSMSQMFLAGFYWIAPLNSS